MMIFLLCVGCYLAGMACFALWDAYIGFGVEFDGYMWPPMQLALIIWPILVPLTIVAKMMSSLEVVKDARIIKEQERTQLRISLKKEQERILKQVEEEMSNVEVEDQDATPYARIVSGSSSSYGGSSR